jgi:hypothetical protein
MRSPQPANHGAEGNMPIAFGPATSRPCAAYFLSSLAMPFQGALASLPPYCKA